MLLLGSGRYTFKLHSFNKSKINPYKMLSNRQHSRIYESIQIQEFCLTKLVTMFCLNLDIYLLFRVIFRDENVGVVG